MSDPFNEIRVDLDSFNDLDRFFTTVKNMELMFYTWLTASESKEEAELYIESIRAQAISIGLDLTGDKFYNFLGQLYEQDKKNVIPIQEKLKGFGLFPSSTSMGKDTV